MTAKRLTKEIAEQFLADEESVDLSEFTEVDDDAAESLSKHQGYCLELNGLTSLSDAAVGTPAARTTSHSEVDPCKTGVFSCAVRSGLRPRARQNGGLLQRILQRFLEVLIGDLQSSCFTPTWSN